MAQREIVSEEEGRLLETLDMEDPLGDSLRKAEDRERDRMTPVGVPKHPLIPKQPERLKRSRIVLKKHPLTQDEWDAIHSTDPYQVYVVRGKPVPAHPNKNTDLRSVPARLKTKLGVMGSVVWREGIGCPACGSWVSRIIKGNHGGHLCCFGCKNTIETVEGELLRRAEEARKKAEEAQLEKVAPSPDEEPEGEEENEEEPEEGAPEDPGPTGGSDGLDEMSIKDLRAMAKDLDLTTNGGKQALMARIRNALAS